MKTQFFLKYGGSAAMLAVIVALTGCSTTVNTVENSDKTGQRNMISDHRVITDYSFNHRVFVVGANTVMTPSGLLKVQVELQNHTDSPQMFNYRFQWFDANGMQVNNVTSAVIPDQIMGREDKFISGVAPSTNCRDFRVQFIGAN
jgi:uncharacterized protein YcfL